jgi:aspartyl-tRNA synthetase
MRCTHAERQPYNTNFLAQDRFVTLLVSEEEEQVSIRDVIAFPKSVNGNDLLAESPSAVPVDTLVPSLS